MRQNGMFTAAKPGYSLKILWLWPDILNQHGERGNVMALVRICALYGIKTEVTRVNRLTEDFGFEGFDIAVLGAGELAVMPAIVGAARKRLPELQAWTEGGGLLFATGTTGAALGTCTTRLDGSHFDGLGLLDMECREREIVLGDDLIFEPEDADTFAAASPEPTLYNPAVYSIQIHMMDVMLNEGQPPFGKTIYGYGNNGSGSEGAVKGGVIFTNALGPVLVKNPRLTLGLINKALGRERHNAAAAGGQQTAPLILNPDLFTFERESAKAIKRFNDTKERPKGAHPYLV